MWVTLLVHFPILPPSRPLLFSPNLDKQLLNSTSTEMCEFQVFCGILYSKRILCCKFQSWSTDVEADFKEDLRQMLARSGRRGTRFKNEKYRSLHSLKIFNIEYLSNISAWGNCARTKEFRRGFCNTPFMVIIKDILLLELELNFFYWVIAMYVIQRNQKWCIFEWPSPIGRKKANQISNMMQHLCITNSSFFL